VLFEELKIFESGFTGSFIRVFKPIKSTYMLEALTELCEIKGSADCVTEVVPLGTVNGVTYPNVSQADFETDAVIQEY